MEKNKLLVAGDFVYNIIGYKNEPNRYNLEYLKRFKYLNGESFRIIEYITEEQINEYVNAWKINKGVKYQILKTLI